MKFSSKTLLLTVVAALAFIVAPAAEARDRDHHRNDGRRYDRGHYYGRDRGSYYSGSRYYGGSRYYRSYPRYTSYRSYYGPRTRYVYRRPVVVYDDPYYYNDYGTYRTRYYYSRPAISVGVGGRHGFFRAFF